MSATHEGLGGAPRDRLTLVVPCFNEAERLDVAAFRDWIAARPAAHLLFVDDGSVDATPARLEGISGEVPDRVSVLRLEANLGKAEAVRSGIRQAMEGSPDFIGFWDADLATALDEVASLMGEFEAFPGAEMVFASRVRLMGRTIERHAWRHYLGRVFATIVSNMLRLPIYDTQCGAKLFRNTGLLDRITREPFTTRWLFDVEMIARAIRYHPGGREAVAQTIVESPLHAWRDVAGSRLTLRQYLRAIGSVVSLYGRYGGELRAGGSRQPQRDEGALTSA
jgi:dolichyl-phosphate beta-glucosyltransferase